MTYLASELMRGSIAQWAVRRRALRSRAQVPPFSPPRGGALPFPPETRSARQGSTLLSFRPHVGDSTVQWTVEPRAPRRRSAADTDFPGASRRAAVPARNSQCKGRVLLYLASGRIWGNSSTSLMLGWFVSSITTRSIPMPMPPAGGMPYSSART